MLKLKQEVKVLYMGEMPSHLVTATGPNSYSSWRLVKLRSTTCNDVCRCGEVCVEVILTVFSSLN